MSMQRLIWLDIAKGIAILLVIIGHMGIPRTMSNIIYSFHMPFFFLMSGFMFSTNRPLRQNIVRETQKILYPYLTCSVIVLLLFSIYRDDWGTYVLSVLYKGWGFFPLWFVLVFYCARLIFFLLYETTRKIKLKLMGGGRAIIILLYVILSALVGAFLSFKNIIWPYNMSSIFAATSFILIGLLLKQLLSRIRYFDMSTFVHVIIVIFAFAICLVGSSYYRLDMCINQILPLIPIFIIAVVGTLMIISLSIIMSRIYQFPVISSCGRNTFMLMAFPIPVMGVIKYFVGDSIFGSSLLSLLIRWGILIFIFAVLFKLKNNQLKWLFDYVAFRDKIRTLVKLI